MKRAYRPAVIIVSLLFAFSTFLIVGCSKKNSNSTGPTVSTAITVDLFPLVVGHQLTYSGYLRSVGTDTNITATGPAYLTTWTIVSNNQTTPLGGTATLIMDTTTVPTGIANPPVVQVPTPLFVQRSSPTGTANFSFLQNIGLFYRTVGIQRSDTLRWILIGNLGAGVNTQWNAFDSTWNNGNTTDELKIVGNIPDQESVTVNGTTFTNTYKLTLTENIIVGGATIATAPLATFWLVANIGPVKMILNATIEANGHYRELKSKNF
jgi:hypothetical protein